jgi:hypothetical protein
MSEIQTDSGPVPVDPVIPVFREWMILRAQYADVATRMNRARDQVAEAVEQRGYRDHKGNQFLDLPFPLSVGENTYSRIKRERRVSVVADEDVAERITRAKGVYDRAFPPIRSLDTEELYVLYQEDALTQADLDEILAPRETYAFKGSA